MARNTFIIIAGLAIIGGIVAAAFFFSSRSDDTDAQPSDAGSALSEDAQDIAPTVPETRAVTEGWRDYENTDFRFGLLYPQELSVHEYRERDGALSVVFENPSTSEGFQIYVTPYAQSQITKERFQLDVSSGVMKEPTDIMVSSVRGTMFWSTNSIMGETREVWFINNGFLYEVVTYKDLDAWLGTIMQSWKFI